MWYLGTILSTEVQCLPILVLQWSKRDQLDGVGTPRSSAKLWSAVSSYFWVGSRAFWTRSTKLSSPGLCGPPCQPHPVGLVLITEAPKWADIEPRYSILCPSITSIWSTWKFLLTPLQYSVWCEVSGCGKSLRQGLYECEKQSNLDLKVQKTNWPFFLWWQNFYSRLGRKLQFPMGAQNLSPPFEDFVVKWKWKKGVLAMPKCI